MYLRQTKSRAKTIYSQMTLNLAMKYVLKMQFVISEARNTGYDPFILQNCEIISDVTTVGGRKPTEDAGRSTRTVSDIEHPGGLWVSAATLSRTVMVQNRGLPPSILPPAYFSSLALSGMVGISKHRPESYFEVNHWWYILMAQ